MEPEPSFRITSGPRWDAVLSALEGAERAMAAPFSEDELDRGWTEGLRDGIVAGIRDLRATLALSPGEGALYRDWDPDDQVQTDGVDDERWDAVFEIDLAVSDLERAELALLELQRLGPRLAEPVTSRDAKSGFDEATRAAFLGALAEVRDLLAQGAYLTDEAVDAWMALADAHGMRRSRPEDRRSDPFSATRRHRRIVQFPQGRRFEDVVLCDGPIMDVASTDLAGDEPDETGPTAARGPEV